MIYSNKKCIICNKIFTPITSRHSTCSEPCQLLQRRISKNKFQKKYHQRNKKKPEYLFKRILLRIIKRCIYNKKELKSNNYINYSQKDFIKCIESQFKVGMSWENYGLWHIDHKKPLSAFKFINDDNSVNIEQIKQANSLNNLQPLWAKENLSKNRFYNDN